MNKKLIAVAVAAGLALPMVSAQAVEVAGKKLEIYGKVHVSISKNDQLGTAADNFLLESNGSRLGFKGAIPLDGGLSGTYKYETEIDVDSATTAFATRNTYIGLKGAFGEVRLGQHDSSLKMAQGKFDQFGDTVGDIKHAGDEDGENRNKNSITYVGKFDKLSVNVQLIPGEGDGTDGGSGQGIADSTSVGVSYKSGPLFVAVATDKHDKKAVAGATENTMTRLVATYKMSGMQFGLLSQSGVEKADNSAAKETWLGASFGMKVGGKGKVKVQLINVKDSATTALKGTQTSIGYDHKLGKKGTVYALYNTITEKNAATTKDNNTVSVGYILKF